MVNPTESDVREIAERRFKLARADASLPYANELTKLFFEGEVILPEFDQTRSWYDFLVKRSRERPRDLVQLVSKLVKAAEKDKSKPDKIKAVHAAAVVPIFSKERVEDLRREVEDECSSIEAIVRTFAAATYDLAGFSMTAASLLKHLERIPSSVSITLYGKRIRQMDEESAYILWKYLFDIGFLGARYADSRRPKGFTHKSVRDDSTLISKDRRHELDLVHWDINPAYRDFLHSLREVEFLGLPNRGVKLRPANFHERHPRSR